MIDVIRLVIGDLAANCYLIYSEATRNSIVIDPGGDEETILEEIRKKNLNIKYIILTHGHFDHIGAVKPIKEATGALVAIHREDGDHLLNPYKNLSFLMGYECIQTPADLLLEDGSTVMLDDTALTIVHTPGHSKGSICIQMPGAIFTGDTLFKGSIGRTDFVDGNLEQILNSIRKKLMVLPDETIVYPGHGDSTTIGLERASNPFI